MVCLDKIEGIIMKYKINLQELNEKIQNIKKIAEELTGIGEEFPALYRNSRRILASIKMLELNISDLVALDKPEPP